MRSRLMGMLAAATAALVLPIAAQTAGATAATGYLPTATAVHYRSPVVIARRATRKFH